MKRKDMIPMKKFMKNEGFTLVELIVVIAILGILAAVAVPAYSGYITKANETKDITALDAVKTAAFAAVATEGAPTTITVTADEGTISAITLEGVRTTSMYSKSGNTETWDDDFKTYLGTLPTLSSYVDGASWTNNTWTKTPADD